MWNAKCNGLNDVVGFEARRALQAACNGMMRLQAVVLPALVTAESTGFGISLYNRGFLSFCFSF
jgi:hypothetical protein